MLNVRFLLALVALAVGILAAPLAAAPPPVAHTADWAITSNLQAIGFSPRQVAFPGPASGRINSDLAFWGDMVVQGTYEGFRLVDITFPSRPKEIINYEECAPDSTAGNQGDITIYGDILVRSWNSNASTANPVTCDGEVVPGGFEGLHVFDISNKQDPDLVGSVDLPCGSHTQTAVPDLANNRLLVYNNSSDDSIACSGIEIVQVPLANPAGASFLRFESSGDPITGGGLPNFVTVNAPSSAAGLYGAFGASFGANLTEAGINGNLAVVNGPSATPVGATPSQGCGPLVGFPAGSIAVVDRGPSGCAFILKAQNAQAAGAVGMIVVNNVTTALFEMTGTDPAVTIPSVFVSQADGNAIKAGLPASGNLRMNPVAPRPCHDTGVILGNVMKAVCAGHDGFSVWSLDGPGGLADPQLEYSRMLEEDVTVGHSAMFSTDGKVIVFGHEPGGGTNPRCAATGTVLPGGLVQTDDMKSYFFFDTESGEQLSKLVLPRDQAVSENCTIHNYNMIPMRKKSGKPRYVLVAGNYQAGISVVDFSDPRHPREIAYADPPPIVPEFDGGDWSTYWYNGRIYESDIARGLVIWRLDDPAVTQDLRVPFLNPQTLGLSID